MDTEGFPRRAAEPMWRRSREEAQAVRRKDKQDVKDKESRNKSIARRRDSWMCRFPRCSCHQLRLHPEVAHVDGSKGMGSDHGTKSAMKQLMCLCKPRHQDSRISIHKGTLRIEFLSADKANGPVRWWVNIAVLDDPLTSKEDWQCVGYELQLGVLAPLTHEQGAWLDRIRELAQ